MKEKLKRLAETVATYFDDLLLIAGGACLTTAAALAFGGAAAFAVCGACMIAYAFVIARAWGN